MSLHFDMTADDIKVFLDEAEEQLQVMEACILTLEKAGENPENLQELFRAAHTLKGSSATLGHRKMAEVTHSMENILDKLRKGRLQVNTRVIDTLFACLDLLVAFKEEIASGEESGLAIEPVLARLASLDEAPSQPGAPAASARLAAGSESVAPADLAEGIGEAMDSGAARGLTPIRVVVRLDLAATMPAVRAFQVLLAVGELGEVISSTPTQEEVEADQVTEHLTLICLASRTLDEIRVALEPIPDISIVEVSAPFAERQTAEASESPTEGADGPSEERVVAGGRQNARNAARTVRVDVDVLDNLMNLVGELVIERTRLLQVQNRLEVDREGDEITQVMGSALAHIGRMTGNLQEEIQRARMLPVENLFRKFPRMVRDVAQKAGKELEFVVLGEETELDRSVIEEISDPLMHLLRNAVDHGIEPPMERLKSGKPSKGQVILEASHEENHIIISIRDDGRGMNPSKIRTAAVRKGLVTDEAARRMSDLEAINLIWVPGFSTADMVSDISGRGVGLDVVHKNIEKLNGSVEIKSDLGRGTEFRVKLPLTLAIIRSLQIRSLETTYCIPLSSVVETDRIPVSEIQTLRQQQVIVKRGEVIPLVHLVEAFNMTRPDGYIPPSEIFVVIVAVLSKQIGIVVDELIGEGDVVIKPLGKFIGDVPGVSGATILGDGDVAIILDISSLINTVRAESARREAVRG